MTEENSQHSTSRRRVGLKTMVKRFFWLLTAMGVLCLLTAMVGPSSPPASPKYSVLSSDFPENAYSFFEKQKTNFSDAALIEPPVADTGDASFQDTEKPKIVTVKIDLSQDRAQTPAETINTTKGAADKTPENLKRVDEVIKNHFDGSQLVAERRAFNNVLRWKSLAEATAQDYDEVSSRLLLAIIKTETQGKTGLQVSDAGAVGLTQIKYEGAWGFLWNALFRKKILVNGKEEPDFYNDLIRKQYHHQLARIRQYLMQQGILVEPKNSSKAQMDAACKESWKRFKAFLARAFEPDEYQVAVDISAMYLNHLKLTFNSYRVKTNAILQRVKSSKETDLQDIAFKGLKQSLWTRVLSSETRKSGSGADLSKLVVARLKRIRNRLSDPKSWIAAYLNGPTAVIRCIENGDPLPPGSDRYSSQVNKYLKIFKKMEAAAHSGAQSPQA